MVFLLFAVSIVAFALMTASPIDPLKANVGQTALGSMSQEQIAKLEEYWGVGQPPVQRYLAWFRDFVRGDMGVSLLYRQKVTTVIAVKLGNSLFLMIIAWILSGLIGFLLGALAGMKRGKPIDKIIKGYCLIISSTPAFWIAMCCMPDYLILDEPVDGLDPVMRRQVWSLIMQDVAERGTTVLVSSHNLRELEDVCDHVGIMNKGKVLLERSLSELQENTVKMQIVFRGEGAPELPAGLNLLHESHLGRVFTIIFRGNTQQITERLAALDPVYMEAVPLTLEEIFIYELGGADYAVRDIVL